MAEVPNGKVIDRYRELLAHRTHDVIVRDAAIEILEQELAQEKEIRQTAETAHQQVKDTLGRANETIRLLQDRLNQADPPVIQGEVVKSEDA